MSELIISDSLSNDELEIIVSQALQLQIKRIKEELREVKEGFKKIKEERKSDNENIKVEKVDQKAQNDSKDLPDVYSVYDVANVLGVSKSLAYDFLREQVEKKEFPVLKIRKTYRIPRVPFEEWLQQQAK